MDSRASPARIHLLTERAAPYHAGHTQRTQPAAEAAAVPTSERPELAHFALLQSVAIQEVQE
jgi:hypothetical protein